MAVRWTITFKTLRGGKTLTASVYDSTYSGNPVPLKGGADPFVTSENDEDDPFKAIRTQSGYLKIVDDGYDANGNAFNWRDLQPKSDYDRPVVLRDSNNTVLWQGFLQAQNFSGTLYEPTQEREYPIQCALSVLSSQYPTTTDAGIVNFAYLLNYISTTVSTLSSSAVAFTEIIVQGGGDAQRWLLKMFHWANLLTDDNEANVTAKYDLYTCLEDMCNYWGWQTRTEGTKLYLMCLDDEDEQRIVTFTPSQLASQASGTNSGTVNDDPFVRRDLTGNIFSSNDNDDMWMGGPSKVIVKADCNEQSTFVNFAPPSVQKQMEDAGSYTWVRGSEDNTGYYTTPYIQSFDSNVLKGTALTNGAGFCRRQYYSSTDQDNPTKMDMIVVDDWDMAGQDIAVVQLQTKRMMSFSDGTLKITGSVYRDDQKLWEDDDNNDFIIARVGIGMTYATAKWYYLGCSTGGVITHGWGTAKTKVNLVVNGTLKGTGIYIYSGPFNLDSVIEGIPVPATMYGYVFLDIIGGLWNHVHISEKFAIGNLKIEFSRGQIHIPSTTSQSTRPRLLSKDRVSTYEYKATNDTSIRNEQNIDLVYATDNNMKFGYGLLMNTDYSYMTIAEYRYQTQYARPEQHFADRIAAFWEESKRVVTTDLRTDVVEASEKITPMSHLVLDGTQFRTLSISHQWRDDVTTVKMIQSLIEIEDE